MNHSRELYEEIILDHNRNPRNFARELAGANRHAHGFNPVCNDEFSVHLQVRDGVIEDVSFEGADCAISTASASLMSEAVKGKTEQQAHELFQSMHNLLTEAAPAGDVGKLAVLAGVHEYPMRIKCATLPWHTLRAALDQDTRSSVPNHWQTQSVQRPMSAEAVSSAHTLLTEQVIDMLRTVYDPELPVNIYDLGLVYDIEVEPQSGSVHIRMTLTAPGCPVAQTFPGTVERVLRELPTVNEACVELVWDPPWDKSRMSESARLTTGMFD